MCDTTAKDKTKLQISGMELITIRFAIELGARRELTWVRQAFYRELEGTERKNSGIFRRTKNSSIDYMECFRIKCRFWLVETWDELSVS